MTLHCDAIQHKAMIRVQTDKAAKFWTVSLQTYGLNKPLFFMSAQPQVFCDSNSTLA
jgi:hypothetical protein